LLIRGNYKIKIPQSNKSIDLPHLMLACICFSWSCEKRAT
jgi:hypothetical protein